MNLSAPAEREALENGGVGTDPMSIASLFLRKIFAKENLSLHTEKLNESYVLIVLISLDIQKLNFSIALKFRSVKLVFQ